MAYDKEELFKKSIKAIKDNSLYFIEDISAYTGASKTTLYDLFPLDSNEMNDLKAELNKNRITAKVKMRKNWIGSDNATLQMGLYKLIATKEERQNLSQSHHDITTKGDKIEVATVDLSKLSDEALKELDEIDQEENNKE